MSVNTTPIEAENKIEDESEINHYKPGINIFTVDASKDSAFISLSDIYPLSDDPDSIAIPNRTENGFKATQYTLVSAYRERFLSQTGIFETDSIFIYDYEHNNLASFTVKYLKVIARLSPYSEGGSEPLSQYDYMIGFEIDKKTSDRLKGNFWNAFVYVGQENPFAQERLTPLVWHKIASQKFPATSKAQDEKAFSNIAKYKDLSHGNAYLSETDDFQYFLQDMGDNEVRVRRLLVVKPQTQEIIIDKVFYESESTSLAALNGETGYEEAFQWTGKLFKNKPPVVFGFVWNSFGCPSISVIDPSNENIRIQCDNRH